MCEGAASRITWLSGDVAIEIASEIVNGERIRHWNVDDLARRVDFDLDAISHDARPLLRHDPMVGGNRVLLVRGRQEHVVVYE